MTPFLISGTFYLAPKLLSLLITHPQIPEENQDQLSRINAIRQSFASTYGRIAYEIGRRNLRYTRCSIVDNLWLASLATYAMRRSNPSFIHMYAGIWATISLSACIFLCRVTVSRATFSRLPRVARFLDPGAPLPKLQFELHARESKELTQRIEGDPILNRWICPITLSPIRRIVLDERTNSFYEFRAIQMWLGNKGTCPLTRQPLAITDLQECPGIQAIIRARIQYLSNQI